jgi:hypothetical protein
MNSTGSKQKSSLRAEVERIVARVPITDIHTHLYDPAFGDLLLWGIDDLLTYHYLVAEAFRWFEIPYETFWKMSKTQQADAIWNALFVEHSPISEACRGVLTTLNALGLDVKKRDLPAVRKWFAKQKPDTYITRCMELAGVDTIYMTNSPFDDMERPVWEKKSLRRDERFRAGLRIDPLLLSWHESVPRLVQWGYDVTPDISSSITVTEVRRFLADWTKRMNARYLMVSLPNDFRYPADNACNKLLDSIVLPHCHEFGLPMALMPGVRRAVNPQLRLAGDASGAIDLSAIINLCSAWSQNRFLTTVLARENQHELCVTARKFRNLHIFGCWWFTNVPYVIEEMTRMRLEMVGLSVTLQHSDARVLDQIIYKWRHSRRIIADVLAEKYEALAETGWKASPKEIERDVRDLFGGAFEKFCGTRS